MNRISWAVVACLMPAAAGAAVNANTGGVSNPQFERVLPDGTPDSWFLQRGPGEQSFSSNNGRHGKGGRLQVSGGPNAFGSIAQKIDPARYRGKLVRLTLWLKTESAAQAGAFLTVIRPDPYKIGFADDDSNRLTHAGEWQETTITGRIAADATAIWIGVKAVGNADVTIDDVQFEQSHTNGKPPTPKALAYLDQAIAILRSHHITSAKANWPSLISTAHAEIAGAKTPTDTYPAIRDLIAALGVQHTVFLPPPTQTQLNAAASAGPGGVIAGAEMPSATLVDDRVGVVRLPGLDTLAPGGDARARAYLIALRGALEQLDKAPLCGWIVDLRADTGGNMWPMLAGLDPLLGSSPFGFFVSSSGAKQAWSRTPQGIAPTAVQPEHTSPAFMLIHEAVPLAVLIGHQTGSSGEMAALALIGRANVRTFGENSAGFLSGNVVEPLPDGAKIAVTEVLVEDRTGKDYGSAIHPDVITDAQMAEPTAKAWIEQQCVK